jgi:MFS family permease
MQTDQARNPFLIPFINLGHFLDHLAMLIFPTVVIALAREWNQPYSALLPYALGGFIAFGAFALPAGWLGDHWGRYRMMVVFFFGIGTCLFLTGFAQSPLQIGTGLFCVGIFAAIYHPVATAMLVADPKRIGRVLGWNGLWGNFGLAAAALVAGALMDFAGWRAAFFVPGALMLACGVAFLLLVKDPGRVAKTGKKLGLDIDVRTMWRIFGIVLIATVCGGIIFNATTVAMPKVFHERMAVFTQTGLGIGILVSIVYCIAALAQVVVGTLIDRVDLKSVFVPVTLLQIPFLFLAGTLDGAAMLVVSVLMMLMVFGQIPLNDAIIGRFTRDEYRARAYAVRYVVSLGVAAVAVPLIALLHRTTGGFQNMFTVLSLLAALTLAAALLLPSRKEMEARRVAAQAA